MVKSAILYISVIFLLFISILFASAESDDILKGTLAKERAFAEIKWKKLQIDDTIEEKVFDSLRSLDIQEYNNVIRLNKEKLTRISSYDNKVISKIAKLNPSAIRKLMSLPDEVILNLTTLDLIELQILTNLDRPRFKELSNLDIDTLRLELAKYKIEKINHQLTFKKRIISDQKIKKSEERYQTSEHNIISLVEEMSLDMQSLRSAVEANDPGTIFFHSKNFLLKSIDAIINHLEKVKSRVEQSQNIDENLALELLKDLNQRISNIDNLKYGLEEVKTQEEISEYAQLIGDRWQFIKIKTEMYVRILSNNKIEDLIKSSEQLEKKLEGIYTELEEQNLDTSTINEKITLISNKIHEARQKYLESEKKHLASRSTGVESEIQLLIIESKFLAAESLSILKVVHNIQRDIIKDIREIYPEVDFDKERDTEKYHISEKIVPLEYYIDIDGFLRNVDQEKLDFLINSLKSAKRTSSLSIEIETDFDGIETNLIKTIDGELTDKQKTLLDQLIESLKTLNKNINIKISGGEV